MDALSEDPSPAEQVGTAPNSDRLLIVPEIGAGVAILPENHVVVFEWTGLAATRVGAGKGSGHF